MHKVNFKTGDTIISEGAEGKTAYLIISGSVEVSVGQGEAPKVLTTLGEGEVFGEMCLIDPGPRSATVKAAADTECLATSYDEFVSAIETDPRQAVQFMQTLVRRLRRMNERIATLDPGKRGLLQVFRDWQGKLPASRRQLGWTDPEW
jgi:CRP-like cAMP-binding protein